MPAADLTTEMQLINILLARQPLVENKCSSVAEMGERFATIDMDQKERGSPVPLLGGAGSPYNSTLPGPRSTSVATGTLIHPAVWPQQTWAEKWGSYARF